MTAWRVLTCAAADPTLTTTGARPLLNLSVSSKARAERAVVARSSSAHRWSL